MSIQHTAMRYYIRGRTLILRGVFRAACTGNPGGLGQVSTLLFHSEDQERLEPLSGRAMERVIQREGLPPDFFGLLTPVQIAHVCILQYDEYTIFLAAGADDKSVGSPVHTSMIICSREPMPDPVLVETIMTCADARMEALHRLGRTPARGPSDGVIVACIPGDQTASPAQYPLWRAKIRAAIEFGVPEALARHEGRTARTRPSFFIMSRYQGDHWVEWVPDECPFYPCHFPGQRCEFCYCPFYPCGDESLGQWVKSTSKNGTVWNCSGCTLLHEPSIADYLVANPEAPLSELKRKKESRG